MILQGRLLTRGDQDPRPGWVRVADVRIAEVGFGEPPETAAAGGPDAIICPGFTDAHIHLPQLSITGCEGGDLLTWLNEVVFPAERLWADAAVAGVAVRDAYRRMLAAGTLAYAGYLTSHQAGVTAVMKAGQEAPLRAVVGQVMIDRYAPDWLLTGGEGRQLARLACSQRGRLALSVNPRFAVACSDDMLARAAARAAEGAVVQTHLSESRRECDLVRKLFPGDEHYAGVYDRHGLLHERTLLAHCLHLSDDEWRLIAERGCAVVHCPTANTFLQAGLFDLDAARRCGVRLALGSDVAAGPDLAMPRVARAMIEVAKVRALAAPDGSSVPVPTPAETWGLITRGNADVLGFEDTGRLEAGASADLLVLRPGLPPDRYLVARLIYTWRDEYIDRVVLNGTLIDPRTPPVPPS